jgi:hypothetical protein
MFPPPKLPQNAHATHTPSPPSPKKNRHTAEPPHVLQVARCYENIRQFREETMQFLTKTVPK